MAWLLPEVGAVTLGENGLTVDTLSHSPSDRGLLKSQKFGFNRHAQLLKFGYLEFGSLPNRVQAPRVNDKRTDEATGERRRFSSAILPAWSRKSPRVAEVLPLLYLHGMSTNDFAPALEQFLGTDAGLSAATINRLTTQWQDEATAFNSGPWPRLTTCTCGSTGSTSRSA
jgi:hypothetical protein